MTVKKQKYRRLQVEHIKLRTLFEVVALITAVVISCVVVVNSYERSYSDAVTASFEDSARQLAHSVAAVADAEAVGMENADSRAYAMERYSQLLDSCFISKDISYSGAIYAVGDTDITLFAQSAGYENSVNVPEDSEYAGSLEKSLETAASGSGTYIILDDTCIALEPVRDAETGEVRAVAAAAVDYRSSTEYDSPVKDRLVLISIVSGVLIIVYFVISGARSEKKKINGEAV